MIQVKLVRKRNKTYLFVKYFSPGKWQFSRKWLFIKVHFLDTTLIEFFKTDEEVEVESLRHSTTLGFSSQRDNSKSGKHKIVYRCRSVLSKRVQKQMVPVSVKKFVFRLLVCLVLSDRHTVWMMLTYSKSNCNCNSSRVPSGLS